ncbi:glycosyltransferase family 61 protein [Aestuariivirga sp.]|uniref:glycosyltransferase family 61 protein n=1 Tax=Aestuariivirga sp. TaxID=2650926 RepID=UPI0039E25B2D
MPPPPSADPMDLLHDPAIGMAELKEAITSVMARDDDADVAQAISGIFAGGAGFRSKRPAQILWWYLAREQAAPDRPRRRALLPDVMAAAADETPSAERVSLLVSLLARCVSAPAGLADAARLSAVLEKILRIAPEQLLTPQVMASARRLSHVGLMRAMAERSSGAPDDADTQQSLAAILQALFKLNDLQGLENAVDGVWRRDPANAQMSLLLARVKAGQGAEPAEVAPLFEALGEACDPAVQAALLWAASFCYGWRDYDRARAFYACLPTDARVPPKNRGQMKLLGFAVPDEAEAGQTPLSPLALVLAEAGALSRASMGYDSADGPGDLAQALRALADAAAKLTLEDSPDLTAGPARLLQLARGRFSHFEMGPLSHEEKYGWIDPRRMRAIHDGLLGVAAAIAVNAVEAARLGHLRLPVASLVRLAELATDCLMHRDEAHAARAMLLPLADLGISGAVVNRLLQRTDLQDGAIAQAMARTDDAGMTGHAVLDRDAWTSREGIIWTILLDEAPVSFDFDMVLPDGALRREGHHVAGTQLMAAHVPGLTLREAEIVLGPRGSVLRAQLWHYPQDYPPRSPRTVAQEKRGVIWRCVPRRVIAEPVVVLESFDVLSHRNYYHWTLLILSRIRYLLAEGHLARRKLVVPDDLSQWMEAMLSLIGLPREQRVSIGTDEEVVFSDALLVSSVELASPILTLGLRGAMIKAAEGDDAPGFLYLARRGNLRRALLNEDEIEQEAVAQGFRVVYPAEMTVAEQVSLFSRARGVAGPEGAAFTNTMFCRPGTRILSILSRNDLYPTFTDLSAVCGLAHRQLLGRGEPDAEGYQYIYGAYAIDRQQAREALAWVTGGPR